MKLKKAQRYISRFSYKPNSTITIEMRPVLVVRTVAKNSRGKGTVPLATIRALFLDDATKQYLRQEVEEVTISQERHEYAEWLCFDGKPLEDPHA